MCACMPSGQASLASRCRHHSNRAPWLRALVLGANDGLVSTAALMMGVGGGTADLATLRLAGVAGMVGGALSMAVSARAGGRARAHAALRPLRPLRHCGLAACAAARPTSGDPPR